ncbi:hypothetical protein [Pontibacter sp. G13]|uniref:hypothetical protein n=1 Tax=Pontibacter sp. G13 TaxID=3074898 RepID=UPI00288B583C|nr:hypothetical protein [Pontibacter sp. G13]WNJ16882.1 hypothetical protein RJD25_18615 [Pontibacter sp. G13]
MKISVSKRHVNSARLSNGKRTPVELAIMEMDVFEDILLLASETGDISLKIDGMQIDLPKDVLSAIKTFQDTQNMRPMSFELPVDTDMFMGGEEVMLDAFDEVGGMDFDLDFN